jgi:alanine dehydrogenase
MKSDIEIAREANMQPITEVAGRLGVPDGAALQYGPWKAKISLDHIASLPIFLDNVYTLGPQCPTIMASQATWDCLEKDIFNGRVHTRYSTVEALEEECFAADLVVGAVLIPGAAAPKLVTREMLSGMKKGAVLVDVAIDQGGCFETSHATTHSDPTYEVDGIIHYCVANMPGAVPVTSAHALNNATLHHGLQLADKGLKALADDLNLRNGLNVHKGRITNRAVAEALGYEMAEPKALLAA